jgi:hypothetical protein
MPPESASVITPDATASQPAPPTEVTAPQTGSEADSSTAATEPSDKPKPKTGEQLRIDELTRRYREEQRRSDRLMRMLEERGQAPAPQATPQQPLATQAEKGLADFNYDEKAFAKYQRERVLTESRDELRKTLREESEAQEFQKRVNAHHARVEKFRQTVEDFDPDIARSEMPFIHRDMADAIVDSEESAAVEYFLWKNPDVARSIAAMPPARAGRAIERIEQALVAERKKAAAPAVSGAPPPAPKIEASGDAGTRVDPTSPESDTALSDAEWLRKREKQIQARAKKG